jgi:pyruvate kinase
MDRRTKIVATIGPASQDADTLAAMIDAGMNTARVSLAHNPLDEAIEVIERIAHVADAAGRRVGILADLPGPKVRAASFGDAGVRITDGSVIRLHAAASGDTSTATRIAIDHGDAATSLEKGDRVVLGDGAIELVVTATDGDGADAEVMTGGVTQGRPGVSIPTTHLRLISPTDDDLVALAALCDARVDHVAISLVTSAADIVRAREVTGHDGPRLIAKIETPEAVAGLDAIVAEADGVMVARGDLGIRCALEDIPFIQKQIIHAGVAFGRPVITATQMLESMVHSPLPTRAEVTDVTTAVFDGTSAVMLSGETAIGRDPVRVIATMDRIARRADEAFDSYQWGRAIGQEQSVSATGAPINRRITGAISAAGWRAAMDADVAAIIACTGTGATPRAISRFRPTAPILAATPSERVARELTVAWGIEAMVVDRRTTTDGTVSAAVTAALRAGHIHSGDLVAVLVGAPEVTEPVSDTLRLVHVT